jgi:DNA-binding GntR family transcriptional regulator
MEHSVLRGCLKIRRSSGYHYAMVQHGTPVPPSWQLAELLREQIRSGALAPGDALPPILTLAREHHISTGTVQKALKILKDEGFVTSVPGYGTFVATR